MTYLELVQFAITRSGVREEAPSTLVGATGMVSDFANWVADAWYELQLEKENPPWWFRMSLDQTLALADGDDEYNMPAGLETLDWRSITVYTSAKVDETPVTYMPYEHWRSLDTRTVSEQRPSYITLRPDNVLQVYPVPDQAYTLRYDGVLDIDELSGDADTPTNLPAQYHRALAWGAIMRYSAHHEDASMLMNAQNKFRSIYDRMVARQTPTVTVEKGRLYGPTYSTGY